MLTGILLVGVTFSLTGFEQLLSAWCPKCPYVYVLWSCLTVPPLQVKLTFQTAKTVVLQALDL